MGFPQVVNPVFLIRKVLWCDLWFYRKALNRHQMCENGYSMAIMLDHIGPLPLHRQEKCPLNMCYHLTAFVSQAMLSWFHGWRSDWCADCRADGKEKLLFCFLCYDPTDLQITELFTDWKSDHYWLRYGHFCAGSSNFTHILWKQPSKMSFDFFFQPTDRLEIIQIRKKYLIL